MFNSVKIDVDDESKAIHVDGVEYLFDGINSVDELNSFVFLDAHV